MPDRYLPETPVTGDADMTMYDVDGFSNPILSPDLSPYVRGTLTHRLISHGFMNRMSQSIHRQFFARDRFWSNAQLKDSVPPEGLVGHEWNDDRRNARSKARSRRARPTMMHHGGDAGKQPVMRSRLHQEDLVRPARRRYSAPPGDQDAALFAFGQSLDHQFGDFLGVLVRHAAKSDVHGRRAGAQEII